jgi:predicted ATPase/DNA-binding winged helix-turn-helix (wHTH) protein
MPDLSASLPLEVGLYHPEARRLDRPEGPVRLTPIEDRLLRYLAERPGQVVSHGELLTQVWGYAPGVRSRTVYTTVDRLRQKIERDPSQPRHLLALSAAGYCFEFPQPSRIPAGLLGREQEWEALSAKLGPGAVVTLVGTGGVGKTRLARAFAEATSSGPLFCDLSACRTVPEMLRALAEALDIPLLGDEHEQVTSALAARAAAGPLLVILDNFEQLIEHAPETLGRWSAASARISWLVTSRSPLGLEGERVLAVEPLAVAGEESPAVALFCQRGQLSVPGFSPTGPELHDIAELVARLDGLPLAIELAAARLGLLSPAQMLARLDQRFRLLGHDPERPERQSTLTACLGWSWELLTDGERAALAQLSVFEGGFALEAAEAVLELPAEVWTLDVLSALVDKSLLCRRPAAESRRFELLQSVRDFAASQLRSEVSDMAVQRHGAFYARWGEKPELDALRTRAGAALRRDRLRDLPNLMCAARRALARRDRALAAQAGLAAGDLLVTRGPYGLLASLLDDLLADPEMERRIELSILRGWSATLFSRPKEAEAALQQSLQWAEERGERLLEGRIRSRLGTLRQFQGRIPESEALFQRAHALLQEQGDEREESWALEGLAFAHDFQGRFEEGRRCYEEALVAHQAAGDLHSEASNTCNTGSLLWRMGRADAALQAMARALQLDRELENRRSEAIDLMNLGVFLLNLGRLEEARQHIGESLQIHRAIGNRGSEASALYNLATTDWLLGRLSRAEGLFREALAIQRQVGNLRSQGITRGDLGGLYHVMGRLPEAEEELAEALRLAEESHNPYFHRIARFRLALVYADQDRLSEARAQVGAEPWPAPASGLRSRVLAELALLEGDLDEAERLAEEGHRQLEGPVTALFRAELFGLQGMVAIHRGELPAAARALRAGEELLRQGQLRMALPRMLAQRAALERAAGEEARGQSTLQEARALAKEMGVGNPRVMGWLATP